MQGAARPSTNTVHVLVALGRVLGEVDPGAEHASYVGMALVEALVDDGVDERRTWGMGNRSGVVTLPHQVLSKALSPCKLRL